MYKVTSEYNLLKVNPSLAGQWHPENNRDLRPEQVTPKSGRKFWWRCEKGHDWQASVNNRAAGRGCPYCVNMSIGYGNSLISLNPVLAAQWHPSKNCDIKPTDVAPKSRKKAWWKCSKGHEWKAVINSRSNGGGCPCCLESRGEKRVNKVLEDMNLIFRRQFPLYCIRKGKRSKLRFDFAIAIGNERGLIEYQGKQHYIPVDQFGGQKALESNQKRDHIKRETCRRLGFPLLEIPHWDFDRIEELVYEFVEFLRSSPDTSVG